MPVRQVKRRYLRFRVISERSFKGQEIADAVQKSVYHLYGVYGLSLINPLLIDFDEELQRGILRCSHTYIRWMRASLAFITSVGDSAASIRVERASGTIRALRSHEEDFGS